MKFILCRRKLDCVYGYSSLNILPTPTVRAKCGLSSALLQKSRAKKLKKSSQEVAIIDVKFVNSVLRLGAI